MNGSPTAPPSAPTRRRSGGRSRQVRLAVGAAVLEILTEGTIDFTTVEVAERAGVSRRTIYRWWPTQADLLAEALEQHVGTVETPDTGSWAGDLRAFAHQVAAFAAAPVDLALTRIMATARHPELNEAILTHYAPVLLAWQEMLRRAVSRGEASERHAPDAVLNIVLAPLFLAPLTTGHAPAAAAVDQVVDLVLDATAPGDGPPPTRRRTRGAR